MQDENSYTALIVACDYGHVKVAMTLINNGAAVNYQSKVTITFTVHCMREYLKINNTIADGIFIFHQNGWTPLLLASCNPLGKTDVVELLIKHGAQLAIKNKVP